MLLVSVLCVCECNIFSRMCIVFVLFVCMSYVRSVCGYIWSVYCWVVKPGFVRRKIRQTTGTQIVQKSPAVQPRAGCVIWNLSSICCCCRPHPPPIMVDGSNIRFYAHGPMVSPHLVDIWARWLTDGPPPFTQQVPHLYWSRPQIRDL